MKKASIQSQKDATHRYTIGRHAFAKISAVEGIHLTPEIQKDFQAFERNDLSPQGRRQEIIRKYAR